MVLVKRKFKNTFDQQSSSGPVYETVSSPQANVIEVETNKAYGYLNEMVSSPRAKVTELEMAILSNKSSVHFEPSTPVLYINSKIMMCKCIALAIRSL